LLGGGPRCGPEPSPWGLGLSCQDERSGLPRGATVGPDAWQGGIGIDAWLVAGYDCAMDLVRTGGLRRVLGLGLFLSVAVFGAGFSAARSVAQTPAASAATQEGRPQGGVERALPGVSVLMHEVEAHQRADEAALKDYIYRSVETSEESNGHGGVKRRTVKVYDVFWLQGVPVRKLLSKDGKALSVEELKKEDERIDKEVAKAKERRERNDAKGKQTSPRGDEEVTVSRFLELGAFLNPRRVDLNGRDAIAVDYVGDPKAKTRNRMEDVIRDLVGTIWVDERDKTIVKLEGRFLNAFKIGGGLLVNIRKDTSFAMTQKKVNGEVWLPVTIEGRGAARAMLVFNFDGSVRVEDSEFRKFKGSATMLPGVGQVDDPPKPDCGPEGCS